MKKFSFATGLVATLAVLISATAMAQPGGGPGAVLAKNQVLIAINRAELSLEQLQTLQAIVQATADAQAEVASAGQALQTFLVNFSGTQEAFDAAFEVEQQKVQAAVEALHALKVQNASTIKDMLTASQFEAMEHALAGVMASERDGNGPDGRGGPNPRGDNAPGRDGPGGPGGPRDNFGGNLNVLLEALTEKIAALESAS